MRNFEIVIASLPDREKVVAEIYCDNIQWAEISQETGDLIVQFYTHPLKKYWEFSLEKAIEVLEKSKKKLLE